MKLICGSTKIIDMLLLLKNGKVTKHFASPFLHNKKLVSGKVKKKNYNSCFVSKSKLFFVRVAIRSSSVSLGNISFRVSTRHPRKK